MYWCYVVVWLWWCGIRMQAEALHTDTTPTHIEPDTTHEVTQRISRKLLRMDVLTSETCWALNKVIIKQVASSWSLFTQLWQYSSSSSSPSVAAATRGWKPLQALSFFNGADLSYEANTNWNIRTPAKVTSQQDGFNIKSDGNKIHQALVLRPICFPGKVSVNKNDIPVKKKRQISTTKPANGR